MLHAEVNRAELDPLEALLWTVMRRFEVLALTQYVAYLPMLATPGKRALVATLMQLAPSDEPLTTSLLAPAMDDLLASAAECDTESSVLVGQGLVLEGVRRVIYATLAKTRGASTRTRSLAVEAAAISTEIVREVPTLFADRCARAKEAPFMRFAVASDGVLHQLDAVGEGVDAIFGERFELRFADVVTDFIVELVPTCTELGMNRRKVMSHLAGALMGI